MFYWNNFYSKYKDRQNFIIKFFKTFIELKINL